VCLCVTEPRRLLLLCCWEATAVSLLIHLYCARNIHIRHWETSLCNSAYTSTSLTMFLTYIILWETKMFIFYFHVLFLKSSNNSVETIRDRTQTNNCIFRKRSKQLSFVNNPMPSIEFSVGLAHHFTRWSGSPLHAEINFELEYSSLLGC
jgi:hypothetical protein